MVKRSDGILSTYERGTITVGIDGSEPASVAARWAAQDAVLRGSRLKIVHVADQPEEFLDTAVDMVRGEFPELAIELVQCGGSPAKILVDESEHSLLTVVGATGVNRISGAFFGSVAARVAAHGKGGIVVARRRLTTTNQVKPGAVVVGVDGSSSAEASIRFAYQEAAMRGAKLVAIHTWNNKPLEHALGSYPLDINAGEVDEQEGQLLTAALER